MGAWRDGIRRSPDADRPGGGDGGGSGGGFETTQGGVPAAGPLSPRRAGSVTLRQGPRDDGTGSPLDPANQSLADALRIMLRLVQAAMIGLAALYVLSGFQTVREGYQGIRLLFGRVNARDLDPGFRWSAPYPLGELVKVDRGSRAISIDRDFWVYVPEGTPDPSPDKLSPTSSLKPDQGGSGSVLLRDGNVAHTRWRVGYHRDNVSAFARNVTPESEEAIVRAAAKRGIVQASASVTIEQLLTQASDEGGTVSARARAVAQAALDRMESGLVIDQFTLQEKIPPLWVRADFRKADTALADAKKAQEEAAGFRNERLNQVAGDAAERLVGLIDAYEVAMARGDEGAKDATLAEIDGVLSGEGAEGAAGAVAAPGTPTGAGRSALVSGEVTQVLSEARRYRSEIVRRRQGDLTRFAAKLDQFRANPLVMVQSEWGDAVRTFMGRDSVQVMLLPAGADTVQLLLNADPDVAREMDKARKQRQTDDANRRREEEFKRDQYKTETGINEIPS